MNINAYKWDRALKLAR